MIPVLGKVALACGLCLTLPGCLFGERGTDVGVAQVGERSPGDEPPVVDGWTIEVAVEPPKRGPLAFSLGPVEAAPVNDARPWVQHELVFENTGPRVLQFADTRTSSFVGPPGRRALLAADEGCGYGRARPSGPVEAGVCATYLDAMRLAPGSSERRTVTLFKGLARAPLTEGTYVFEKTVRYAPGRAMPTERTARELTLRLVYVVARA